MSKRKYLPIAANSSRRPLIPVAPTPQLRLLALAIRWNFNREARLGRDIATRVSYHAAQRINRMLAGEPEPIDPRLWIHKDTVAYWRKAFA